MHSVSPVSSASYVPIFDWPGFICMFDSSLAGFRGFVNPNIPLAVCVIVLLLRNRFVLDKHIFLGFLAS